MNLKFDYLLSDRGGLLYPTIEFVSRLWTVYKFIVGVLPLLTHTEYLLKDFTAFLLPKLEECSTFKCLLARQGETSRELLTIMLRKLISPLLVNKAASTTALQLPEPHKYNINIKNRRWLTLKQ